MGLILRLGGVYETRGDSLLIVDALRVHGVANRFERTLGVLEAHQPWVDLAGAGVLRLAHEFRHIDFHAVFVILNFRHRLAIFLGILRHSGLVVVDILQLLAF